MVFSAAKRHVAVAFTILIVTVCAYSNALKNPFLMDDHAYFFSDMTAKNPAMLGNFFFPDMRKTLGMDKTSRQATYYRPLAYFLPNLFNMLFHGEVFYLHAVNLISFALLCFMIYLLILRLGGAFLTAFGTALFFGAHPVNGLMVNYITAIVFSVQLMLLILSVMLFYYRLEGGRPYLDYLSLMFFLVSLLCHETSMFLPFYLGLVLWYRGEGFRKWKTLIPYLVCMLVYALLRMYFSSLKTSIIDKYTLFNVSFLEYIFSFARLAGWYVSKLFYPVGIVLIRAAPAFKGIAWSWLLLGIGLLWGLYRVVFYYSKVERLASLGILFFLFGFLPAGLACLLNPDWGFMFEPHWMFFPSIGFFLWLASLIVRIGKKYAYALMVILIVPWIVISRQYNELWSDEKKYCRYWLEESPQLPGAILYLADAYARDGDFAIARKYYLMHKPDSGVLNNIGLLDLKEGKVNEAREVFLRALGYNPNSSPVNANLASLELKEGNLSKAREYASKAMELNRYLPQPRFMLMRIEMMQNKYWDALQLSRRTFKDFPDNDQALFYLVVIELSVQQKNEAREHAQLLLKRSRNPELLSQLRGLSLEVGFSEIARGVEQKIMDIAVSRKTK